MGNFNKKNKFGGRGGFGGGRDGGRPTMHQATCDKCGSSCEVPFRPTGDKPIFCNDCFKNKVGGRDGGGRDGGRRDGGRRDFGGRDSRPRFGDKRPHQGGGQADKHQEVFNQLNSKLDKIISLLSSNVAIEAKEGKKPKSKEDKDASKAAAKAVKKEVNIKALKKVVKEAKVKKPAKKAAAKKPAVKKVVKKKVAAKKSVAKKKKK